jgi:hypothetical protein
MIPEAQQADAPKPAMALWPTIEDQWRRVAELKRWAPSGSA